MLQRFLPVTVALLAAMTLSPSLAAEPDMAAVRAGIDKGNARYIATMAKADAHAFAQVYDPSGGRFSPNGVVTKGRDAIEAEVQEYLDRVGPVRVTIETVDLWYLDGQAYETGKWTYTYTAPGEKEKTIGGRYVTVWRRQSDGEWKIFADMGVPGTSIE